VFAYVEKLIYFFLEIHTREDQGKSRLIFRFVFVKGLRLNLGIWDFYKNYLSHLYWYGYFSSHFIGF